METLPLPDNLDCERFVLGALLCADPARTPVEAILASLAPADFSLEKHKRIFQRMEEIQKRGEKIDRITLADELMKHGQLQSVDGLSYLVSLDDGLPVLHALDSYIGILRDKAMLRKLIADVQGIEARAYRGESPGDLAEELRRIGEGLQPQGAKGFETAEQIIERVTINELITPSKAARGIDPPFHWLRQRMSFEPKTLTVLAAETGEGKSAFAMQVMQCAAADGHRVAFYTMEMSNEQVLCRSIGQMGRVNMHRLRIGLGEKGEIDLASRTASRIAEMGDLILLRDAGTMTLPVVRQDLLRRISIGRPIKLLIVDYLQLLTGTGKFGSRADEVAAASRGFKLIAQDFGIPVLVLSQFSRPPKAQPAKDGSKKWKRGLGDLKESSGIEQDANHIVYLERITENEEAEEQEFDMHLKKQRMGPKGTGKLRFVQRYARFEEVNACERAA